MRIFALLSWWDEQPDHLRRCVRSLKGFADYIVAVDGPYATMEHTGPESPLVQQWALSDAAHTSGLKYWLIEPRHPWESEVAKRAGMFEYGRKAGATPDDWLLIIDADMELAEFTPDARAQLEATDLDTAEVRWHDMQINNMPHSTLTFRSLFRALPGLTVERAHYLYTMPCPYCNGSGADYEPGDSYSYGPCEGCSATGRRFLWHAPSGQMSQEPALDLTQSITLHHYNSQRDPERRERALAYYKDRDARGLETAGDWR